MKLFAVATTVLVLIAVASVAMGVRTGEFGWTIGVLPLIIFFLA